MICGKCCNGECGNCMELEISTAKLMDGLPDHATAHYCPCQHRNFFEKKNKAAPAKSVT